MSPTKPRPAITKKISSAAVTASSIPHRVKAKPSSQESTNPGSITPWITIHSSKRNASMRASAHQPANDIPIFSDSTATLAPERIVSYYAHAVGANKENIPFGGGRPNVNRANNNGGSPIRLRSGITKTGLQKQPLSPHKKRSFGYIRVPLRELDAHEVFERDEAVLGDLRRRRSGEHSGTIFEIDSVVAFPSSSATNAVHVSSTIFTDDPVPTTTTGHDERATADNPQKLRVLRRSESEEALRTKLDTILASASSGNKGKKGKVTSVAARQRSTHPAVRQLSPGLSPHRSETSVPSSPAKSYVNSLRIRHSASPIAKASPSPIRQFPKKIQGTKAINTILSEKKLVTIVEDKDGEKAKKIINTSISTGEVVKKKAPAKKAGTSSLKRAAGRAAAPVLARDPSRPPLALTEGKVMGLEGMRKMR